MTDRTATIQFSDGAPSVTFPLIPGTIGPDVIDIRKLYAQTGKFTYDPGFLSTASCNSTITYIDGDKGELLYRGYPIEELAVKCDFLDVCYLLLYGELPSEGQRKDFDNRVTYHTMVNEQMQFFMRGFRRDAHPMAVMTGLVGALSAFYPDSINLNDAHQRDISAIRLIATFWLTPFTCTKSAETRWPFTMSATPGASIASWLTHTSLPSASPCTRAAMFTSCPK